ncbi:hypothetical protein ACOMHN_002137 [Nucella lapillus]
MALAGTRESLPDEGEIMSTLLENGEPPSVWEKRKKYRLPRECVPSAPASRFATTDGGTPYIFCTVKTLSAGDVFVSCGAEIIALEKSFFLQHANLMTQQAVLNVCIASDIPSPKNIMRSQRDRFCWNQYIRKCLDRFDIL